MNLSSDNKHLVFDSEFNEKLKPGDIPDSVAYITFRDGSMFNQEFGPGIIPLSVINIVFDEYCEFNQKLKPGDLPNSVRRLRLPFCFNQELLVGSIPYGVESLSIGHDFNQELKPGLIPNTVIEMIFDRNCKFDKKLVIGSIPDSVTKLILPDVLHNIIDPGVLPNSITELDLSYEYQLLPNVIPNSVKTLCLDLFVTNVTDVTEDKRYVRPGMIPNSVTLLFFSCNYNMETGCIPDSVTDLYMGRTTDHDFNIIPNSVETLIFQYDDFTEKTWSKELYPGCIPDSVTTLRLGPNPNLSPGCIPDSVIDLSVDGITDSIIFAPGNIPKSVKYLRINHRYIRDDPHHISAFDTLEKIEACDDVILKGTPEFDELVTTLPTNGKVKNAYS